MGWILLAIGATWGLDLVCSSYATYGLELHRGSHDLAAVAASIDSMLWVPGIGLTGVFLLLLFPDGHLLTPRWRWLAWPSAVGLTIGSLAILFDPGLMTDSSFPNTVNPLGIDALGTVIQRRPAGADHAAVRHRSGRRSASSSASAARGAPSGCR